MGLKAVFFDLDDTLYSSFKACDAYALEQLAAWAEQTLGVAGTAFADAFRTNRLRFARQQPGMPPVHDRVLFAQGALERLGLNAVRYARAAHRVYWEAVFSKMELRPGVTELLDDLRAAGIQTAVCTDMLADIQMEKLERLGLADQISYLVTSEEAGMDKPGAPIFWLAMHKCGCLPHEAVMVGDNFRHDIQGATDLGIGGIWLNWTHLPRPEDERDYFEAHSFEQAAAHIRSLL
ncbi:HAD family hydrolase [Agathobaculum desmolans]|uniref:HAD family hydrolase n=1 Tax=Agathobaculum desmolans TaxID=39484 RepID=UPI00248F32C5|nr:HAD-IA family hydrolase [Agathobaculum desmolans]